MGRDRQETAEELMARLESDPEWVARRDERERICAEAAAEFDRSAEPVKEALREAGVRTERFGKFGWAPDEEFLPEEAFDEERAVPVLLEWLPKCDVRVRETVVRHLSTKLAKPSAGPPLLAEFLRTPTDESTLKWTIGSALDVTAGNELIPQLREVAADPAHGEGRQMIVLRIGRGPKDSATVETLIQLLDDEDVALHAMSALRQQLGPADARPHIEARVDHQSDRISAAATRELKKIDAWARKRDA